jgi:hypothetical protein
MRGHTNCNALQREMPFWIVSEAGRKILKLEGAITVRSAQEFAAKLMEDAEGCGCCSRNDWIDGH